MNTIAINGAPRSGAGKKATKAVRNGGGIPCIMYGGDTNITFSTTHNDIKGLIYTPDFKIAEINLDGTVHKCIIKDIQFHPVTEAVMHADFLKLEDGRPVKLEVPIRTKGTSPGVKTGGKLQQLLRRAKIKTTPDKIVDELLVDISEIELGQSARVKDLDVPDGIEVMNSPSIPVVSVEVPRALRSAEAEGEEGAEGGEEGTEGGEGDAAE